MVYSSHTLKDLQALLVYLTEPKLTSEMTFFSLFSLECILWLVLVSYIYKHIRKRKALMCANNEPTVLKDGEYIRLSGIAQGDLLEKEFDKEIIWNEIITY